MNKLFWFDCDFDQVHESHLGWLDTVVGNVAQQFECEAVRARYPIDIGGAKNWGVVFKAHPPTAGSIFLMHGRTPGVQEALESLWESAHHNEENLPSCRVVYSGGSEWSHLGQTAFKGSWVGYCQVKPNSFKWGTAQRSPDHVIGSHYTEIVESYVRETKSAQGRLKDFLFFSSERVFESAIGVVAAILEKDSGDEACANVLQMCLDLSDAAGTMLNEWPDPTSPEHELVEKIRHIADPGIYEKYENPDVELDCAGLLRDLFRGGVETVSLYGAIKEGLEFTSNG